MKTYEISNSKNDENYTLQFESTSEARHWIINHLDLSLDWSIKSEQLFLKFTDTITGENYYTSCYPWQLHKAERIDSGLSLWCEGRIIKREQSAAEFAE